MDGIFFALSVSFGEYTAYSFFKDVNMKNTGSRIVCVLYSDLKNPTLFSIKDRSLDAADISRNEGIRSQNKSLIDLISSKPSNTRKQNKTKPSQQITETVRLILEISRTFKDHE